MIGIPVGSVDGSAVAMGDTLDGPFWGLNIERTRSADCYSAGIDAAFVTFWDDGFH